MHPNTVNRSLGTVSSLFNWAIVEELINAIPMRGIRAPNRAGPDTEREIFSSDALRLLFQNSPLYRGCRSHCERTIAGSLIIRDEKFWLPLIGLYSGMRLEEIAQLRSCDFRCLDGIWDFDVNCDGPKRLKTTASERMVPVHPELIQIGLPVYAAEIRNAGETQLWPNLKPGSHGSYSASVSKWFGRYKRYIGISNPRVTFHSFRHTVINRLKQKGVEESKIKELVGHKDNSITMNRYGKRYEPRVMLETVKVLDYRLNLGHLMSDGLPQSVANDEADR